MREINSFRVNLNASFQAFPEAVVAIDTAGTVIFLNPMATELLGYSEKDLLKQPIANLFLNQETVFNFLASHQNGEKSKRAISDCCLKRQNGVTFMSEVFTSPLLGEKNERLGHLFVLKDITEQSTLEALVHQAASTLEEALESISEGFALYDRNDRLVICNSNYREIYKDSAEAIIPGNTFEDIIRYGLDQGQYNTDGKSTEEWLAERVTRHQKADASIIEQNLGDGRWLQIAERKTRSGGIAGIRTDITALKNAQAASKQAFESLETLANSLSSSITESDLDGRCEFVNEVAAKWMASTREELIGETLRKRLPGRKQNEASTQFIRALKGDRTKDEINAVFPDGVRRDVLLEYIPKRDAAGNVIGVVTFGVDITDRKNKERTLASLYSITSARDVGHDEKVRQIVELGCQHFELPIGIIWDVDQASCTISHLSEEQDNLAPSAMSHLAETYSSYKLQNGVCISVDENAHSNAKLQQKDDLRHIQALIGAPIYVDGKLIGNVTFMGAHKRGRPFSQTDKELICQFSDWIGHEIARQRDHDALIAAHARLEQIASTDDLTSIFNRRAFLKLATRDIARFRRTQTTFSVLMVDIDHFKSINDTFGHAVGDSVLKLFSEIISSGLRAVDIFGRVGGEEFCILLHNTPATNAFGVAERLRQEIEKNCIVPPMPKPVTCSIGITEIDRSDVEFTSLLQRADVALYESKQSGRNRSTLYTKPNAPRLIVNQD